VPSQNIFFLIGDFSDLKHDDYGRRSKLFCGYQYSLLMIICIVKNADITQTPGMKVLLSEIN